MRLVTTLFPTRMALTKLRAFNLGWGSFLLAMKNNPQNRISSSEEGTEKA